jgi:5-methylcytosine-specific restriction endonuclease McrBC regulatory subunit McrC
MMLLRDVNLTHADAEKVLPGFLWDSNDLFERSMRRLFSEAARPLALTASKRQHELTKVDWSMPARSTYTTPDIDIHNDKGSVLILDAKYKTAGSDPAANDVYQIMAAGRVRGTEGVALVYPSPGSAFEWASYTPLGDGLPTKIYVGMVGVEAFADKRALASLRRATTQFLADVTSSPPT